MYDTVVFNDEEKPQVSFYFAQQAFHNRSGANRTVTLDISKAFDKVWDARHLHKLKSRRVSGQIFGLILSFLSSGWP